MSKLKKTVIKNDEKIVSLAEYLPDELKQVLEEKLKDESRKQLEDTAEEILDVLRVADNTKEVLLEEYRREKAALNRKLATIRSLEDAMTAVKEKGDYRKLAIIFPRQFGLSTEDCEKLIRELASEESKGKRKNK